MNYLIDGYNLLFRLLLPDNKIEYYRESLITILERQSEEKNIKLTVVFDAHNKKYEGSRTHKRALEIIYTDHGETADAYILAHLTPNTIVVTSDQHLARHVKNSGHKSIPVEKFIKMIKPKKTTISDKNSLYLHDKLFEYYLNAFESNFDSDNIL